MNVNETMVVTLGDLDGDDWQEVLYKTGALINEGEAGEVKVEFDEQTSEVIGVFRVVAGTEDGPTQWYDVRVEDGDGTMHERRFIGLEQAVFGLALRRFSETESRKALGW